ncbi:MAG: BrnA antitoxin family protein [Planctomycetaceae bacterium]
MKANYDFSKATRNPYAKRLKKQLTIRLDTGTIEYFQSLAGELGVPYQTLINMYLRDCAARRRRPEWAISDGRKGNSAKPNRLNLKNK